MLFSGFIACLFCFCTIFDLFSKNERLLNSPMTLHCVCLCLFFFFGNPNLHDLNQQIVCIQFCLSPIIKRMLLRTGVY